MKQYEFGDTIKLTDGLSARVVSDTGGDMLLVSVIICGWGDPMCHIRRDEIVEEQPVCSECSSVIYDRAEQHPDGRPLCGDCYGRLYGARDAEDAIWARADANFDQLREGGRRW